MAIINYLDFEGLQKYDALIKGLIAQTLKYVELADGKLKFYKSELPWPGEPADFEISITDMGDLSQLIKKVADAKENNIPVLTADGSLKDSGVSIEGISQQTITFDVVE